MINRTDRLISIIDKGSPEKWMFVLPTVDRGRATMKTNNKKVLIFSLKSIPAKRRKPKKVPAIVDVISVCGHITKKESRH